MKNSFYCLLLVVVFVLFFHQKSLYSSAKKSLYGNFFKNDVDAILSSMTLREKIGQLLMFGFKGYDLGSEYRNWIVNGELGNIKIFLRNVKSGEQLSSLTSEISILFSNTRLRIPPFIATDLEGGMVNHIRYDGIRLAPSAALVSASRDYKLEKLVGRLIAYNLLSAGINMNFAPCFDVLTSPLNSVIDTRSYSSNPYEVYRMASIFIDEHKKLGIITVPKHFPGHGMSSFDSHTKVGTVSSGYDELLNVHIFPYLNAIGDDRLDACMVSNIIYSSIDSKLPASLSPSVIKGLLRDYLGFRGIVITDDLEMKGAEGIAGNPVEAFVMAFKAGCDILLFAHTENIHKEVIDEIPALFKSGVLDEINLDEKVRRILLVKKSYLKKFYKLKEERRDNERLLTKTEKSIENLVGKGITLLINKTGRSTKKYFLDMKTKNIKGIVVSPSKSFTSASLKYLSSWKVVDAWYFHKNKKNRKRIRMFTKSLKKYDFAVIGFSNNKQKPYIRIFDKYKIPYALFIVNNPLMAINNMRKAQIAVTSYGDFSLSVNALFKRVFEIGEFEGVFPYKFDNYNIGQRALLNDGQR